MRFQFEISLLKCIDFGMEDLISDVSEVMTSRLELQEKLTKDIKMSWEEFQKKCNQISSNQVDKPNPSDTVCAVDRSFKRTYRIVFIDVCINHCMNYGGKLFGKDIFCPFAALHARSRSVKMDKIVIRR